MRFGHFFGCGLVVLMGVAGCTSKKPIVTEPQPPVVKEAPGVVETVPVQVQEATPAPVQKAPVAETADVPAITFKEISHDFGSVGPSSSHTCEFTFTNTGKAVLKIDRIHAPCGCTIPELEKKEYAPGESGTIKVRYNAPASAATIKKPIFVYSNDPVTPQLELSINAKVQVNVSVTPDNVSLLLDQDNAGMPKLTLKSIDGKEFSVTSITSTNEVMDIPFDAAKKATEIVLEPKVNLEKLESAKGGVIQVHTDHPQSGVLMVRFDVKPLFEVSRPRIILQNVQPGEEVVRDVLIKSNYDKKVEIESFSSTNGTMTIESQKEEGNHLQIMVKITLPTDAPASSRRYITDELKIKLKDGHELSVRCSGWFRLK